MLSGGSEGKSSCHGRNCWQASSSSWRLMGKIMPVSLATAMNSFGITMPLGRCQRVNASNPTICSCKDTIGW